MKLLVLVVIVAAFAGLGFHQGWFHLGSQSSGGKSEVTVTVDKDKIKEDEQKAEAKVKDLGRQTKEKAVATVEKAK